MGSRLYTTEDLSPAELHAARLDGDLYAVGTAWASLATPDTPELRASSLRGLMPRRAFTAERRTAAWVWGARSRPPIRHTIASSSQPRSTTLVATVTVREVVLPGADVVLVGAMPVTTPGRTVLDLLRTPGPAAAEDDDAVSYLLRSGAVSSAWVRSRLEASIGVPHARQALRKLRRIAP